MKKIIIGAIALSCAAAVTAQQTVVSANIVGYNKITITDDNLILGGVHFIASSENKISEVLGDSLPIGTKAYLWNGSGYQAPVYDYLITSVWGGSDVTNGTGWTIDGSTETDASILAGEGFWLVAPAGTEGVNDAILSGEVEMADSVTTTLSAGLNLVANPYPTEVAITNMGFDATIGDKIYLWTGTGYTSLEYNYLITSVWGGDDITNGVNWTIDGSTAVGNVVEIGEGFWYDAESGFDWIMNKPF